jgi:hypothetical protein
MSEHTQKYDSLTEMFVAAQSLGKFSSIHHAIRDDYAELIRITENNKSNEITFDALYRASLRSLFLLIEADIYGLNILDQYLGYRDNDPFIDKFKATFKQIAITWNKEEIKTKYFDTKLTELKELRKMRDELVHPKEISHIHKATELDFEKVKTVFNDYDTFINDLMNNFFVGTIIPFSSLNDEINNIP